MSSADTQLTLPVTDYTAKRRWSETDRWSDGPDDPAEYYRQGLALARARGKWCCPECGAFLEPTDGEAVCCGKRWLVCRYGRRFTVEPAGVRYWEQPKAVAVDG